MLNERDNYKGHKYMSNHTKPSNIMKRGERQKENEKGKQKQAQDKLV